MESKQQKIKKFKDLLVILPVEDRELAFKLMAQRKLEDLQMLIHISVLRTDNKLKDLQKLEAEYGLFLEAYVDEYFRQCYSFEDDPY